MSTSIQSIRPLESTRNFALLLAGGVSPRIPTQEASIISLRSEGLYIAESFVSLLTGSAARLQTPVALFGHLPFLHLQMNGGVIQFLRGRPPWGLVASPLSLDYFTRLPLFQRLFQNWVRNIRIEGPTTQAAAPSGALSSAGNPDQAYLNNLKSELQTRIDTLEPELKGRLDKVNQKLAQQGKPPLDFQKATQEVQAILNNPNLSDKQKKEAVENLRKRLGLGKGDMKALFTKRLAKIYGELTNKIKDRLKNLEAAVKEAEKTYGKDSPQAAEARNRLASARQTLEPTLQQWDQTSRLLHSMYPSFLSKLGGFFKKIGKGILKVAKVFSKIMNFVTPFLKFIPGIGQMISFGWGALKGLVSAIRGNFKGVLGNLLNGVLKIPGVPTLSKTAEYLFGLISPKRQTSNL